MDVDDTSFSERRRFHDLSAVIQPVAYCSSSLVRGENWESKVALFAKWGLCPRLPQLSLLLPATQAFRPFRVSKLSAGLSSWG